MPRKAAVASVADRAAAPGGAAAVDRALTLLAAFRGGDRSLGLSELAARTGLYKSTALRLLASLEHGRLLQREDDGRWSLGPELARLHALRASGFAIEDRVLPVLRELVAATRESAAFHVRQGGARLCLYRVDSPQLLRDHVRAGDLLPLDRGAGARVLLAFAGGVGGGGARGRLYEQIRRDGVADLIGDRVADVAGISAPVFGPEGALQGALTLTLPASRHRSALAAQVRQAALRLSQRLGAPQPAR
jgi:DNA-binding IclR family transcriptional regulator